MAEKFKGPLPHFVPPVVDPHTTVDADGKAKPSWLSTVGKGKR